MKMLKQLFLIISLLLFGGILFATDTPAPGGNDSSENGKNPNSNPKDCVLTCVSAPKVDVDPYNNEYNPIVLSCLEEPNFDDYKVPDNLPQTSPGKAHEVCPDGTTKPPVDVKVVGWTWAITGTGGYQAGIPGTYTITSTGTAIIEPQVEDCGVTATHTFDVELKEVVLRGPPNLLLCDEEIYKAEGGTAPYSFFISKNAHLADLVNGLGDTATVKGKGIGGEIEITVVDVNGCQAKKTVKCTGCTEVAPKLSAGIDFILFHCETGEPGDPFYAQVYQASNLDVPGNITHCVNGVEITEDLNFRGIRVYNWSLNGPGVIYKDLGSTIFIKGADQTTQIVLEEVDFYDGCEENSEVSQTVRRNAYPPNRGPKLAGMDGKESNSFAQSNKFAMLDIHGKPQTIVKPQAKSESDSSGGSFSIDAYHLTYTYSELDFNIPLQGSDLTLQMKRTNSPEKASPGQGGNEDNIPHKTILGKSWRTNIAPVLYLRNSTQARGSSGLRPGPNACDADLPSGSSQGNGALQIIVQDENGSSFRYNPSTLTPEKQSFSDPEAELHKLEEVEGGYKFTKKNGTILEFESVNFEVEDSEREGLWYVFNVNLSSFARVKSVADRNGNRLIYNYPSLNAVLPDSIHYEKNPAISLSFTYNAERTKLLTATDPLGNVTTYEHTGQTLTKVIRPEVSVFDPITKIVSSHNPEINYTYTSTDFVSEQQKLDSVMHALESIIDAEGNNISLTYTTQIIGGQEPARKSPVLMSSGGPGGGPGVFASFQQDLDSQEIIIITSISSSDGTAIFTMPTYTSGERTIEVTDTSGYDWTYNFDVTETPIEYTNNKILGGESVLNGFTRSVQYSDTELKTMSASFIKDESGAVNLNSVTDYYGNITKYEYGIHPVTFYRNGVEVTEDYNFGHFNQPFRETTDATPEGGNPDNHLNITKEFGYESSFNQMVRIVDPNGNTTTYDIDNEGNRIQERAPLGKTTTFTYELGFQTSSTDADGRYQTNTRVDDGNGWTITSTVSGYNDELNITTLKRYDLVGNLRKITDANGNETDHFYDATNMLERLELPAVEDIDNNGIETRPTIRFKRDRNRQLTGKQDARGNWTLTEYDGMLRPKKTTVEVSANNTENIVTLTEYDKAGNKSIFTDARGTVYTFEYDAFNNLVKEVKDFGETGEFLNQISTYEYGLNSGADLFGGANFVPTQKIDARGISTLLEYDNAYRLVKTSRGFEGHEPLLSEISYDNTGNVVRTVTYNNRVVNINGEYSINNINITKGNQETVTIYDALNRPISTAVDLDGDGASTQDTDDIVTNTFYDLSGNVIITIDAEGHSSQTEYDGAGRVVKQLVNLDDDPQFGEIDSNQYAIIAQDMDIVTTKSYDGNGNVLTETIHNNTPNAVGDQTVVKTYDALNRLQTVQDPEGNITETKYDLNSNARYIKNGRGNEKETEYDEANRAIKQTLPEVFNAEANNGIGENENPEVLTFYDTNSNLIKTVDARGLVSLNTYDALNRLQETRQVIGADDRTSGETDDIVSENEYDDNNNLIRTTFFRDDQELTTTTVYDALDRPLITIDPEGFQSVVFCDLVGNKVKLFDKRANTKIVNNEEVKDAIPQLRYFTQVTFDRANRMIKNTLPKIPLASRDEFGDVNEENIQPFSEVVYLKNNWVDSTIDLNGNETSTIYDNAGRKLTVTNAIGQEISYIYDKSSNVLVQTVENNVLSGGNQVTTYTYDKRNLLKTETLNKDHATLERIYEYTYDENGNKKTRIFPNGDTTTYNYDALDRLNSEVYTNAADENRTYNYNNNGAVITCTDDTGTVKYEYDILGRQVSEIKLNSNDIAVSEIESIYDKANNRIRCFFPSEKKTLVSLYDKRNLLTTMKGFHGKILSDDEDTYPGQAEITTYTYNANGTQLSNTLPNGQTTTKVFDQADRIINSTTSSVILAETINSYTAHYKRDAVGNQLQAIETRSVANGGGTRTRILNFIYDDIYRLTVESDDLSGDTVVNTYIYDLQGNRTSRIQKTEGENDQDSWIYTNDILNRTTTVQIDLKGIDRTSSYNYSYDTNGNREVRTHINEDSETSTHTYSYDQENRLVKVNDGSDDIFKASYDYRTRRTAKTEVNAQDQFETVSYIYDGGVSCQEVKITTPGDEYDGTNGSLDKQYIRGNGMGGGIGSVCYMERPADFGSVSSDVQNFYDTAGYGPTDLNGSSNMLAEYYAYNAVGSVVANTDQQGFVIRENDFDANGRVVREEDHTPNNFPEAFGGSSNDLLFSTKERDYSTGLDNFGFRYYDSVLGKFITRDPSGYPDGPNNYLYCNNNPINCIDPFGLSAEYDNSESIKYNPDTKQYHRYEVVKVKVPTEYYDDFVTPRTWIMVDRIKWGKAYTNKEVFIRAFKQAFEKELQGNKELLNELSSITAEEWAEIATSVDVTQLPAMAGDIIKNIFKDYKGLAKEVADATSSAAGGDQQGIARLGRAAGGKAIEAAVSSTTGGAAKVGKAGLGKLGKIIKKARKSGSLKKQALENLKSMGLKNVNLKNKSFNSGRKSLEKQGFTYTGKTKTGRHSFENDKGVKVHYDSGKALVKGQKNHWHIQDKGGQKYDMQGRAVDSSSRAGHIPAKK